MPIFTQLSSLWHRPLLGPGLEAFRPWQILMDMGGRGGAYSLDNRTGAKLMMAGGRKEENVEMLAP